MDKVLKKRAETEGKPAANPKFLWPKPQSIKLKLSQSASATETAKNHRVLTCYGQYYDPLTMINNIPTFYADYADQVQVPDIDWLDGKNTKFVPKDPVHQLPGKIHYSNSLSNGKFFKLRFFLRNDVNLVEFST